MRVRQFANSEKIRSKERRLGPVLHRHDLALLLGAMPKGILTSLSHTTTGTTSTINTPLRALVDTDAEEWQVDFADTPDPTGGFANVSIPAAKQVGELKDSAVLSFAGQSVGNYVVYAQHSLVEENPEQRDPPGQFAGGTGVFPAHRTFFQHGKADGTPIPREGYDSTLTPETISESVDRLTIAFAAEASVPADATPLLSVVWDGSSVVSSEVIARELDFADLYDHIGSGGAAHSLVTVSTAGFMSATDKIKLDTATSTIGADALAKRDSAGRMKVADPSAATDIATKGYVDGAVIGGEIVSLWAGRINSDGTAVKLPAGWSSELNGTLFTITHNLGTFSYLVLGAAHNSGLAVNAVPVTYQLNSFVLETRHTDDNDTTPVAFRFLLVQFTP